MDERELFIAALQIKDAAQRSAYLDKACGGDAGLRQRMEGLLQAFEQAGSFLQQPADPDAARPGASPADTLDHPGIVEGPGTVIGPYKLLEQIGEGGFGVVFMAEQTQPVRRKVALKVLKPGMDTRQVIARFEAERQALAIMDHPHIAKVLDGGTTASGRPYFVMEFVKGLPITRYCDDHQLSTQQRLELFLSVCEAVQHAHQKGIIHRDLKPSNVLVSRQDTTPLVKVIDFGVAKALGQVLTDKTMFTGITQMIGTPLYMSPEQAGMSDLDVDTRSDIYSLGVLLYELLTGTTPFDKERLKQAAHDELRRIIREEEPPKPSTRLLESKDSLPSISAQRHTEPAQLTKLVQGELDWIVMKALEKDRSRRYETANGFAADVRRYLADEPVQACPPSASYRLRKFARRRKAALVTAGLVITALVLGTIVSSWQAIRATKAERLSQTRLDDEMRARQDAELARQEAQQARLVEQELRTAAEERERTLSRYRYNAHISLAQQDWEIGSLRRMPELLNLYLPSPGSNDLRGFEWYHLSRLLTGEGQNVDHSAPVRSIAMAPQGDLLATGGKDGFVRLWSFPQWQLRHEVKAHSMSVEGLAFAPDGKVLVSVGGTTSNRASPGEIKLLDPTTGAEQATLEQHTVQYSCLAISPDSRQLAAASGANQIKFWDLGTRESTGEIDPWDGMDRTTCLAFSSDGKTLAIASLNGKLGLFDGKTHETKEVYYEHEGPVFAIAYHPKANYLATGSYDNRAILWDLDKEAHVVLDSHVDSIRTLAFSPSGDVLATGANDQEVKFWSFPRGDEQHAIKAMSPAALTFSPDGNQLVTAGASGKGTEAKGDVRVWKVNQQARSVLRGHHNFVYATVFSPDSTMLATAGGRTLDQSRSDHDIKVWNTADGREEATLTGHTNTIHALAFSTKGDKLISAALARNEDGELVGDLRSWAVAARMQVAAAVLPSVPYSVAHHPNDSVIAVGCQDGTIRLFELASLQQQAVWEAHAGEVRNVRFSSDGQRLASSSSKGDIKVWDVESGRELLSRPAHPNSACWAVRFSNKDGALVSAGTDGAGRVWNIESGNKLHELRAHRGALYAASVSADGKRVVTAGTDRTVRIWDFDSGDELLTLKDATSRVWSLDFSPDGKALAAGLEDGTIRLWRAAAVDEPVATATSP